MRHRVQSYCPALIPEGDNRLASVAMIIRNLDDRPQMFFIERAKNANDPWSGQIAFPGGNREAGDASLAHTAMRETREEVGLHLDGGNLLGRMDDQQGRNNYRRIALVISCFVFEWDGGGDLVNGHEVGDSFWVDLSRLTDPANRMRHHTPYSPDPYPAIRLSGEQVLWGLTYRFVQKFLAIVQPGSPGPGQA